MAKLNTIWRKTWVAQLVILIFGILVALALDDWYKRIQEDKQEKAWVRGLYDDLQSDKEELRHQLEILHQNTLVIEELIESIDNSEISVLDTVQYFRKLKRATLTYPFRPTNTTYTELTGSGALSSIRNRELIRAYISYLHSYHLTEDLNQYVLKLKWFDYNEELMDVIEPTALSAMTKDYFKSINLWPDNDTIDLSNYSIDLARIRGNSAFRTALARNLDATILQLGDVQRMLINCEGVLNLVQQEIDR